MIVQPKGSPAMTKVINCECGFVASGGTDDEVVSVIRGHMASDHPDLLSSVDPQDLYGWIQEV
jgi:predicted small metal-binding protein